MGVLTLYLDKCTNLKNVENRGVSDPYVTSTVKLVNKYVGDRDMGQYKSNILKNKLEPKFDQEFEFVIEDLDDMVLYMSVKDDNGLFHKDAFMGKIQIKLDEVEGLEATAGSGEAIKMELPLEDVPQGTIHFCLKWKY